MKELLIRKFGNLLEISPDGKSPLSKDAKEILEPLLTYTFQQRLYGIDRKDPITGFDRPMRFEDRCLYKYDDKGRLVCGAGLLAKVTKVLNEASITTKLVQSVPNYLDPHRFDTDWDSVLEHFQFRKRQDECLCAIADNEYGVIDAPTGFGKGVIMAMVCLLFPKATIHVVTRRKDIVAKTVRFLSKYVPNVGQVGGGVKKPGPRITVYTADSLHLAEGDADILLADEAHELMAPVSSEQLARYMFSRNYAFTATPEGRMDKADAKMESLFGPTIFGMTYDEAVRLKLVVPIHVHWIDVRLDINPCAGKKDVPKKRWGLWRNYDRNCMIADKAREFKDEQVLILVETVEHAVNLGAMLPEFKLCYADMSQQDFEMYKRQDLLPEDAEIVTPQERERLRQGFEEGKLRKVIATDVWSTGVDFQSLQVLIRADARSSDIMDVQAPGRVCRIDGEKEFGVLVDCMDHFDSGLHLKSMGRSRSYRDMGWEQAKSSHGRRPKTKSRK